MGNCQAAEAATVVVQHPAGNRVDRIYWSVSAHEVMNSNPGHYVALVVASPPTATPVKQQLKVLKPDDTLLIGQVYRLISFEDVLKELSGKKSVKLGRLLKERGGVGSEVRRKESSGGNVEEALKSGDCGSSANREVQYQLQLGSSNSSSSSRRLVTGRHHNHYGGGQWRPALQSISEIGT